MNLGKLIFFIAGVYLITLNGAYALPKLDETQNFKSKMMIQFEQQPPFAAAEVMNKMTISEHVEMYRKFFFEKGDKTPKELLPQQQVELDKLFAGKGTELKVSWLGHSSLLINIDGHTILTDPIFERKVSLVGPTKFNNKMPVNVQDLPVVDVVIISHDHYDHLNKFSIQQLIGNCP